MSGEDVPAKSRRLKIAERAAWTIGVLCLAGYAVVRLLGHAGAHREIERFEALRKAPASHVLPGDPAASRSLWSVSRIRAFRDSLKRDTPRPLAILRIPKIGLEVPVLEGTDDWTLNRAVGHIDGTAAPGDSGNCGLAGHRDGFFRGLKDVRRGDVMELSTLEEKQAFRVESVRIVEPEDVSVLDPTPEPSLSLVTCYPFYFVGSAPQRYVVLATRLPSPKTP